MKKFLLFALFALAFGPRLCPAAAPGSAHSVTHTAQAQGRPILLNLTPDHYDLSESKAAGAIEVVVIATNAGINQGQDGKTHANPTATLASESGIRVVIPIAGEAEKFTLGKTFWLTLK